jgi:hypothetical protein
MSLLTAPLRHNGAPGRRCTRGSVREGLSRPNISNDGTTFEGDIEHGDACRACDVTAEEIDDLARGATAVFVPTTA